MSGVIRRDAEGNRVVSTAQLDKHRFHVAAYQLIGSRQKRLQVLEVQIETTQRAAIATHERMFNNLLCYETQRNEGA